MTLIRTIRDIVIPTASGTHIIDQGTYLYVYGDEAEILDNGVAVRAPGELPGYDAWLFIGQDIEIPVQPIGGGDDVIPF